MTVETAKRGNVTPDGIGRPDYSQPVPRGTYPEPGGYTMTDAGELAARLGSPAVYDRRGKVVFIDDFEGGIGGLAYVLEGTGAAYQWCGDRSYRGGFSLKLTAGSDGLRSAQAKRYDALPGPGRLGFATMMTLDADMEQVEGYLDLYTGTFLIRWGYKYVAATQYFSILLSDGTWKDLMSGAFYPSEYQFGPAKLVVNYATVPRYTRIMSSSVEVTLDEYAPLVVPSAEGPHLELYDKLVGVPGTNSVTHLDSMIYTENEPANYQA